VRVYAGGANETVVIRKVSTGNRRQTVNNASKQMRVHMPNAKPSKRLQQSGNIGSSCCHYTVVTATLHDVSIVTPLNSSK